MNERIGAGQDILSGMFDEEEIAARNQIIAGGGFGSKARKLSLEYCFGTIWERPGLTRRERSLITIAMLAALRLPEQLKNHVRAGIKHGLTVEEIEEVCIHATAYIGFPAASVATQAAEDALRGIGRVP